MKHNKNSQNANHSQTSPQQHGDFLAPTLAHDVCSSTTPAPPLFILTWRSQGDRQGKKVHVFTPIFASLFILYFRVKNGQTFPIYEKTKKNKLYFFCIIIFTIIGVSQEPMCFIYIHIFIFIYYTWDVVFITCNYIIIYLSNFIVGAITFHIFWLNVVILFGYQLCHFYI